MNNWDEEKGKQVRKTETGSGRKRNPEEEETECIIELVHEQVISRQ